MDVIRQARKSYDSDENLDGSDFEDEFEDEIYDYPEQDETSQGFEDAHRTEDNDDEIYDTPEDAKKIQFMIDSRERKQDSCSDGNDQTAGRNCTSSESASVANRVAQMQSVFNHPEGGTGRPVVPLRPKAGVKGRWPPAKTDEDDNGNMVSPALPSQNENISVVLKKLSKVIRDGSSSRALEDHQKTTVPIKASSNREPFSGNKSAANICAPKIDRSDKPSVIGENQHGHTNESQETAMRHTRSHSNEQNCSSSAGIDPHENYDVPRSLRPGEPFRQPWSTRSERRVEAIGTRNNSIPDDEEEYVAPLNDHNAASARNQPIASSIDHLNSCGNPNPMETQKNLKPSPRGRVSYADIIVRPGFRHGINRDSSPLTQSYDESQQPPSKPSRGNVGLPPGRPSHSRPTELPLTQSQGQSVVADENYEVPSANSAPELSPSRPSRGNVGLPPGRPSFDRPTERPVGQSQGRGVVADENYEVPDAKCAPELPPGRPPRGNVGLPPGRPSLKRPTERPVGQSQGRGMVPDENYEIPDAKSAPELPPSRPSRGNVGLPPGRPSLNRPTERPVGQSQGRGVVADENYEVPDAKCAPELPPDRPPRGNVGLPPGRPSLKRPTERLVGQSQGRGMVPDENYEIPDAKSAPELPPSRPSRGNVGLPPGRPSLNRPTERPGGQSQGRGMVADENYEIPDAKSAPELPPSRPSRGNVGLPPGRPSLKRPTERPVGQSQGRGMVADENYEVPDCSPAPLPAQPSYRRDNLDEVFTSERVTECAMEENYEVMDTEVSCATRQGSSSSMNGRSRAPDQQLLKSQQRNDEPRNHIFGHGPPASKQMQRCPPEGQESKGINGRDNMHSTRDDKMLNQVLAGLTNPQQRPNQPPVRQAPQKSFGSEAILDLSELQSAMAASTQSTSWRKAPPLPSTPTIEQQRWFFGDVERQEAERLLRSVSKDGAFIVRNTKKVDGYSISIYFQGDIRHLQIHRKDGGYHLGSALKRFESVEDLVSHFKDLPIELKKGGETKLTTTVPKK